MINVLICGALGKMGANIVALLDGDEQAQIVAGVDRVCGKVGNAPVYDNFGDVKEKIDVIIDFSSPAVLESELAFAKKVN